MKALNHFGLDNLEYLHWMKKRSQGGEHISIFYSTEKEMGHLGQKQ